MAFGCQVNNPIGLVLIKNSFEFGRIQDVYFFKNIIRCMFNIPQVFEVACIGECIQVDDFVTRVFIDKQSYNMRADKAGTAGDYDGHFRTWLRLRFRV